MIAKDLICQLLDYPMDSEIYVGKGMGPLTTVKPEVTDRIYVVLSP
jgi:hypothetical protein